MTNGPRENIVDHPHFDEVLKKAMQKNNLHETLSDSVRRLVSGQADPKQYVCCDSGCVPCVKDYLRAAEAVLRELPVGPPTQRSLLSRLWPFSHKKS
jgi:hypothetical protein